MILVTINENSLIWPMTETAAIASMIETIATTRGIHAEPAALNTRSKMTSAMAMPTPTPVNRSSPATS